MLLLKQKFVLVNFIIFLIRHLYTIRITFKVVFGEASFFTAKPAEVRTFVNNNMKKRLILKNSRLTKPPYLSTMTKLTSQFSQIIYTPIYFC